MLALLVAMLVTQSETPQRVIAIDPSTNAPVKFGDAANNAVKVNCVSGCTGGGGTSNVNVQQVGGTATATGNGTTNAGTQRVTLSSDSTGQVASLQSGTWSVKLLDSGGVNQLAIDGSGRITVLQGGGAWSVTQSGTWSNVGVTGTFWPTAAGSPLSAELSDGTSFYVGAKTGQLPTALDGSGFLKVHEQGTAAVSGTVTANQGTAAAIANSWVAELTDGTHGPAAVKAASTAAAATDPSLVVGLSPNSPLPAGSNALGSVSVSNFPGVQPTQDADAGISLAALQAQVTQLQAQNAQLLSAVGRLVQANPVTGAGKAFVAGGNVSVTGLSFDSNGNLNVDGGVIVTNFPTVQGTQDFDAGVSLAALQSQMNVVEAQLAALNAKTVQGPRANPVSGATLSQVTNWPTSFTDTVDGGVIAISNFPYASPSSFPGGALAVQTVAPVQVQFNMNPLNPLLPRCNAVRTTQCQP